MILKKRACGRFSLNPLFPDGKTIILRSGSGLFWIWLSTKKGRKKFELHSSGNLFHQFYTPFILFKSFTASNSLSRKILKNNKYFLFQHQTPVLGSICISNTYIFSRNMMRGDDTKATLCVCLHCNHLPPENRQIQYDMSWTYKGMRAVTRWPDYSLGHSSLSLDDRSSSEARERLVP